MHSLGFASDGGSQDSCPAVPMRLILPVFLIHPFLQEARRLGGARGGRADEEAAPRAWRGGDAAWKGKRSGRAVSESDVGDGWIAEEEVHGCSQHFPSRQGARAGPGSDGPEEKENI